MNSCVKTTNAARISSSISWLHINPLLPVEKLVFCSGEEMEFPQLKKRLGQIWIVPRPGPPSLPFHSFSTSSLCFSNRVKKERKKELNEMSRLLLSLFSFLPIQTSLGGSMHVGLSQPAS